MNKVQHVGEYKADGLMYYETQEGISIGNVKKWNSDGKVSIGFSYNKFFKTVGDPKIIKVNGKEVGIETISKFDLNLIAEAMKKKREKSKSADENPVVLVQSSVNIKGSNNNGESEKKSPIRIAVNTVVMKKLGRS